MSEPNKVVFVEPAQTGDTSESKAHETISVSPYVFSAQLENVDEFTSVLHLMHNYVQNAVFVFTEFGLQLVGDNGRIYINMPHDNFDSFGCKKCFAKKVNLKSFCPIFTDIRSNSTVTLQIETLNQDDICIRVVPARNQKDDPVSVYYFRVDTVDAPTIDIPSKVELGRLAVISARKYRTLDQNMKTKCKKWKVDPHYCINLDEKKIIFSWINSEKTGQWRISNELDTSNYHVDPFEGHYKITVNIPHNLTSDSVRLHLLEDCMIIHCNSAFGEIYVTEYRVEESESK